MLMNQEALLQEQCLLKPVQSSLHANCLNLHLLYTGTTCITTSVYRLGFCGYI
ncbi:hypothetical protein Hanom_Chr09g00836331 [Helianthus anomalus]